jgi:hypothetical protein
MKTPIYCLLLAAATALAGCETDTREVRVVHHHYYDDSRPDSVYYPAYRTTPVYSTSHAYESEGRPEDYDAVNQYDRQSR